MMQKPLILIGGGGHCKSVIESAESVGFEIIGILDKPNEFGKNILNYQVIGSDEDIPKYIDKVDFVITVGFIKNPILRIKLYYNILDAGGRLATIIASTAHVSKYATIGQGTVILHQSFINAGAKIGNNVIINTFANVEHDAVIGSQTHISTGAMINGDCIVGERCFIGSQSVLSNAISVCDDTIVSAASFVRKNIMKKGIYSGNPALLKIRL